MTMKENDYESVMQIMAKSSYHCDYSKQDIEDLIEPALHQGKYVLFKNGEEPYIFATWAFPEKAHIDEYLETRRFPSSAFYANGSAPWIVEFIALNGPRSIIKGFRYLKDTFRDMGYIDCHWLRTETQKIGFHKLKEA